MPVRNMNRLAMNSIILLPKSVPNVKDSTMNHNVLLFVRLTAVYLMGTTRKAKLSYWPKKPGCTGNKHLPVKIKKSSEIQATFFLHGLLYNHSKFKIYGKE
jgi:hypothetical protein